MVFFFWLGCVEAAVKALRHDRVCTFGFSVLFLSEGSSWLRFVYRTENVGGIPPLHIY